VERQRFREHCFLLGKQVALLFQGGDLGEAGVFAGKELGVFDLAAGAPAILLLLEHFPLLPFFFSVLRLRLKFKGGAFGRARGLLHGGATVGIVAAIGGGGGMGRRSRSGELWCVVMRLLLLRWIVILIVINVIASVTVGWCII